MADEDNKVQEENTDAAETPAEETVEETAKTSESETNGAAEPTPKVNESNEEVEAKPTISEQTGSASDASTTDEPAPKSKPVAKSVSKDLEKIIEQIEKLSVLELADLVHALEERFGVSASAPVAVAPSAGSGQAAGEAADEGKTTFNVILSSGGANKISVIKAVRELVQTLGLKEAKDLVEGAPKPVLEGVNKETAEQAKTKLTSAGGTVELQ